MINKINERLYKLKERPEVYLGEKSLSKLMFFISGYIVCMYETYGNSTPKLLPGFQEFIEEYYNIKGNTHLNKKWSDIIRFFSLTEEDAFNKFYDLLYSFHKKENISNLY